MSRFFQATVAKIWVSKLFTPKYGCLSFLSFYEMELMRGFGENCDLECKWDSSAQGASPRMGPARSSRYNLPTGDKSLARAGARTARRDGGLLVPLAR